MLFYSIQILEEILLRTDGFFKKICNGEFITWNQCWHLALQCISDSDHVLLGSGVSRERALHGQRGRESGQEPGERSAGGIPPHPTVGRPSHPQPQKLRSWFQHYFPPRPKQPHTPWSILTQYPQPATCVPTWSHPS